MKERWWLVDNSIIYKYGPYYGTIFYCNWGIMKAVLNCFDEDGDSVIAKIKKLIPRGVPFDNLHGDETEIHFEDDHYFWTVHPGGERHGYSRGRFPEEWKDKTFPITEELKRLLNGETL